MKNELTENYSLFNTPPAMYADEELEAWGELYCKLELYARGEVPFVSFMALSVASRRRCLQQALNHPLSGLPASLHPVKGITTPPCWAPLKRTPAWMHAYRDAGGRAASGTSGRGGRAASGTGRRGELLIEEVTT